MTASETKALRGLYAITPDGIDKPLLLARVEAALRGGVKLVQYRDKKRKATQQAGIALDLRALCRRFDARLIVNALLFPYLNNAVRMLMNGTATMEDIDTAMKGGCNFPMGPFALLDLVGLDTSLAILDALYDEFRDPNFAPAPILRRMVVAGHLGRNVTWCFSAA